MDKNQRDRYIKLAKLLKKVISRGDFVLTSGKKSSVYLDASAVTLTSEGAYLIATCLWDKIKKYKFEAIGGPSIGADPIVGAVCHFCGVSGKPLKAFLIRNKAKTYGKKELIEGPKLDEGLRVFLIDDVATSGKSLLWAVSVARACGLKISGAAVVVDREEGARNNLAKQGIKLESIFKLKELL